MSKYFCHTGCLEKGEKDNPTFDRRIELNPDKLKSGIVANPLQYTTGGGIRVVRNGYEMS